MLIVSAYHAARTKAQHPFRFVLHIRLIRADRVEIRRTREFVEREFRNPALALAEAAQHAGLSPAHFSHVFRQTTGTNFIRFVQARRVTEAKKQLAETQNSITDICYACGFNSLTHFNRVFRGFELRSPRQHRANRDAGNTSTR